VQAKALRKTPLHAEHVRLGAKMVEFFGWDLPLHFSGGILKEHEVVRKQAGIFDVSHMGEILLQGKDALAFANRLLPSNVENMKFGEICYTPMCNAAGGVVDDLLAYKIDNHQVLLVVNASNVQKDFQWIKSQAEGFQLEVLDRSEAYAQIAVQGPAVEEMLRPFSGVCLEKIPFYSFEFGRFNGIQALVSRTGYTGEDGFEFYVEPEAAVPLWRKLIEIGAKPAGLGARDLLRFEACYMLYGNELDDQTTPLEAGLKWTLDLEKDFVGRDALLKERQGGLQKKLRGLEVIEKGGIPRHGNAILHQGKKVGTVTSGNRSPSAGKILCLGYVPASFKLGQQVDLELRENKTVKAQIIKLPFYRGSVKNKKMD